MGNPFAVIGIIAMVCILGFQVESSFKRIENKINILIEEKTQRYDILWEHLKKKKG